MSLLLFLLFHFVLSLLLFYYYWPYFYLKNYIFIFHVFYYWFSFIRFVVHWWFGIVLWNWVDTNMFASALLSASLCPRVMFTLFVFLYFSVYKNEVSHLRNEVAHLKQLLIAHKDCPVTNLQKKHIYMGEWSSCWGLSPASAGPNLHLLMSLRRGAHERYVWAHGLPGTGHSAQLSGPQPLVRGRPQRPELPCRSRGGGHVSADRDGQPPRGERRAVTRHHGHTVPPIQQMMRAGNSLPGTLRILGEGGKSASGERWFPLTPSHSGLKLSCILGMKLGLCTHIESDRRRLLFTMP